MADIVKMAVETIDKIAVTTKENPGLSLLSEADGRFTPIPKVIPVAPDLSQFSLIDARKMLDKADYIGAMKILIARAEESDTLK